MSAFAGLTLNISTKDAAFLAAGRVNADPMNRSLGRTF